MIDYLQKKIRVMVRRLPAPRRDFSFWQHMSQLYMILCGEKFIEQELNWEILANMWNSQLEFKMAGILQLNFYSNICQ